ncbi:DUF413 domain-containing protein [Ferrimonas pelagia]|uniref:Macrodomain Ori protein n=1 Tax=Ferrimonas pelagia TaxID=1177826 RepID=A0ABP9F3P0_9GAMM
MTNATATDSSPIQTQSFDCNRLFVDQRYPRGLARSGSFTISEAQRLEQHGVAYQALSSGDRIPANEEEARFVDVAHGEQIAQTPHEKVWMKYQASLKRRTYALTSNTPTDNTVESDDTLNND